MPSFLIDLPAMASAVILAAANPCPPATPVKVELSVAHNKNPVEKTVTSYELTQRMKEQGDQFVESGWWTGGINSSKLKIQYNMPYRHIRGRDGSSCFMPVSFVYKLTYENQIYIAEDFKHLGCRYSATLNHERTHERMDMTVIKQYEIPLRRTLQSAVAGIRPVGPVPAKDLEAAVDAMMKQILASLDPVIEQMNEDRRKKHALIDNEESYRRDTALCPNQFPRMEKGPQ